MYVITHHWSNILPIDSMVIAVGEHSAAMRLTRYFCAVIVIVA